MTTRRTHQDGSVFQRGKWFVIRYRVRGHEGNWVHKAETVRSTRKKDAQHVLAQRLRSVNSGVPLPKPMLFADFIAGEWARFTKERWKRSTQATFGSFIQNHLLPYFGGFNLSEVSPIHVQTFMDVKREEGLGDKTRLHLWHLLERIFSVAMELDLVTVTPMRKKISKPRPQTKEKPVLDAKQLISIFRAVAERYRTLVVLVSLTGVRIGEALGLKWEDIDFTAERLHFRRSIWCGHVQTPKSKASVRAKHLTPALAAVLHAQWARNVYTAPGDFVFASSRGTPLNPDNCRAALYRAMDAAGVKRSARAYGFHLLRHTAGSLLYGATGDLKQTSSYLGHSSIGITADTYIHLAPDSHKSAANRLATVLLTPEQVDELCSNCAQKSETVN
jgi:integrase